MYREKPPTFFVLVSVDGVRNGGDAVAIVNEHLLGAKSSGVGIGVNETAFTLDEHNNLQHTGRPEDTWRGMHH